MKQEMKICLQGFKLAYSILFIIILSLVRGISTYDEIGIAIVPYLAILASVFCADTYLCEWNAKRGEVFCLISKANRKKVIIRRLFLQVIYLWTVGAVGYFLFFWQKPFHIGNRSFMQEYGCYLLVILWDVIFWSTFAMTISNLLRNQIAGIGGSIVLWLVLYSKWGEQYFGNYNLFSYVFRDGSGDLEWVYGSMVEIVLSFLLIGMVPLIMKKRG